MATKRTATAATTAKPDYLLAYERSIGSGKANMAYLDLLHARVHGDEAAIAEHDEEAQSILVCPDQDFIEQVKQSIERLLEEMPRKEIIKKSLEDRAAIISVDTMEQAIEVANLIAPEHLELSMDDAQQWAKKIRHAGAIFMGRFTAEALGDYCAGPNHVLPTSGTARFSSPLGVYDFQKRSSLIGCSHDGASELGKTASQLAHGEGLIAHARSAEYRIKD